MPRLVRLDHLDPGATKKLLDRARARPVNIEEPRLLHMFSPRVGVVSGEGQHIAIDESLLTPTEILAIRAWTSHSVSRAPLPTRAWDAPGYHEPIHLEEAEK